MNYVLFGGYVNSAIEVKLIANGNNCVTKFDVRLPRGKGFVFIKAVAWGETAQYISSNFAKDSWIQFDGELVVNSFEKQDGSKVYTSEYHIRNLLNPGAFAPGAEAPQQVKQESHDLKASNTTYTKASEIDVNDTDLPF